MNRTLPLLWAVVALCACTTTAQSAPGPIGAGWDWRMAAQEDSATLAYRLGPQRKLEFECHGGQDPELGLMVWAPSPPARSTQGGGKPEEIILIAGGERQIYPTLTEAGGGDWEMMGHARKNDLVIQAFRETGWLSVEIGGRTERFIPTHGNTAVSDFFEWCH